MTEADGPILVSARNPGPLTGAGNNTWLIDGADRDAHRRRCGAGRSSDELAGHLGGRALAAVIVTHSHADHAAGVPALMARWPGIEPWKWVRAGELGWRALGDGQQLRAGIRPLTVLHTPGHAPDHVCLLDSATGDMYTGDMVTKGNDGHDSRGPRRQPARVPRIARAHGVAAPLTSAAGTRTHHRQAGRMIAQYIDHRLQREIQVVECLRDGVTDVDRDCLAHLRGPERCRPAGGASSPSKRHCKKLAEDGLI